MKNIIQQVAEQYQVTEQEVRREIDAAIRAAMQSDDAEAQKFWAQFQGETPSAETVIACIRAALLK